MDKSDNDESMNLHYHAINYRGASIENVELYWQELVKCVERKLIKSYKQGYKDCENPHIIITDIDD